MRKFYTFVLCVVAFFGMASNYTLANDLDTEKPVISDFQSADQLLNNSVAGKISYFVPVSFGASDTGNNITEAVYGIGYKHSSGWILLDDINTPLAPNDGNFDSKNEIINTNIGIPDSFLSQDKNYFILYFKVKDANENWSDIKSVSYKIVHQIDSWSANGWQLDKAVSINLDSNKTNLTLSEQGKMAGYGMYTSRLIDTKSSTNWSHVDANLGAQYGKELVNWKGTDQEVDMKDNLVLLHMSEIYLSDNKLITPNSADSSIQFVCKSGICPQMNEEGVYGKSVSFSGQGEYFYQDATSTIQTSKNKLTMETWVKPTDSGAYKTIIANNSAYYLALANLKPVVYINGLNKSVWYGASTTLPLNEWSHIATVYDGSELKIYVNGVLDRKVSGLSGSFVSKEIWIGNRQENLPNYRYKGMIDELAIYDRALSDNEIYIHYKRGSAKVKFQVMVCDTEDCAGRFFVGPDNTSSTYYDFVNYPEGMNLPLGRYFQYQLTLKNTLQNATPEVKEIRIAPFHAYMEEISTGTQNGTLIDQTDDDNTATGFGGGVFNGMQWDDVNKVVTLNDLDKANGSGEFISRVMDASVFSSWKNPTWKTVFPSGKELYNNGGHESGYDNGNIDMAGNLLLYHFERNSTDSLSIFKQDNSGKGNNGNCPDANCPIFSSAKLGISSAKFDGVDDYISAGSSDSLNISSNLTMEAWLNPSYTNGNRTIIARDGSYYLSLVNLKPAVYLVGISKPIWVATDTALLQNKWSHVVATYNGTSIKIYVNGVEVKSLSNLTGSINSTLGKELWVGGRPDLGSAYRFRGSLDEVAVYNRVLSAQEVQDHYRRGATDVKLQIRTCNTSDCSGRAFFGPLEDTNSYFYDWDITDGTMIGAMSSYSGRYFQYRIVMKTDDSNLVPQVKLVKIVPDHYLQGGDIIPVSSGQLEVGLNAGSPISKLLASGTTVTLAVYNFVASVEDIELNNIYLTQNVADSKLSSYKDIDEIWFEDATGTEIAGTRMSPISTKPLVGFADGAFVVKTSDLNGQVLYLKARLANTGLGFNGVSGHQVGFKIDSSVDVDARGISSGNGADEYFGSLLPIGATHYVYKSYPVFQKLALDSNKLGNGIRDLFKFRISSVNGDVGLNKFTFDLSTTNVGLVENSLYLYDVTNSSNEIPVNITGGTGALYDNATVWQTDGSDWVGSEINVSPAQSRTFILRGSIANVSVGSSISTSIAGDAGAINGITNMLSVSDVNNQEHNDFIWSDLSDSEHSNITLDWTNGYLVSGLASNTSALETVFY